MAEWDEDDYGHCGPEGEMFQLDPIEIPFEGTIRQLTVNNDLLGLIVDDPNKKKWQVISYNLSVPRELLSKTIDDDVHKIFMDPRSVHLIISLESGDNYYCNLHKKEKAMKCSQICGMVIESVGWDKSDTGVCGGSILLGDTNGNIYEARHDQKTGWKPKKLMTELADSPVTSLDIEKFEVGGHLLVIATASSRLFQYVGGPTLEAVFANDTPFLREMPGTQSDLRMYRRSLDGPPIVFAWSTKAGIMHGRMNFSKRSDTVLTSETVLSLDGVQGDEQTLKGLTISEHHFFLLYADRIQVIAQPPGLSWVASNPREKLKPQDLKERTVWSKTFPAGFHNEGRNIVQDPLTGKTYIYSKKLVLELFNTSCNNNTTWKSFLERAMNPNERDRKAYFQVAEDLCVGDPNKTACVNSAMGDYYFEIGEYGQAAKVYSQTTKSFEEIVIKFMKNQKMDELLGFLLHRLKFMQERLRTRLQERTQLCCLCTWVVQLYLVQLNDATGDEERYEEVQEEFHSFIEEYLDLEFLDKSTVCELLASLANPGELLYFVELLKDYRRVIAQHVTHGEYEQAMNILSEHCAAERYDEVWYQFSPRLIQHQPVALVSGWMQVEPGRVPFLKPPRLIPALIKYHVKYNPPGVTQNQAIRYLQWLVNEQGNKDQAIHNMLLSLYAKQSDDTDLLDFLEEHSANPCYDLKYALRLCLTEDKHRACVHIYSALQLYEDAVQFALEKTGDIRLAKEVAEKSDEDEASKKRLWMCIVRHIVTHHREGVKQVIAMLPGCRVLELEDILPFFPDFRYIQDFKKEICDSLTGYNNKLETLKVGMDEVTRSAEGIKEDISEIKGECVYVSETESCCLCMFPVLVNNFLVFPACGHYFHEKCIVKRMQRHLKDDDSDEGCKKLKDLRDIEDKLKDAENPAQRKYLRTELQELLAHDCPYCGELQIKEVSLPFISERERLREVGSWKVDGGY